MRRAGVWVRESRCLNPEVDFDYVEASSAGALRIGGCLRLLKTHENKTRCGGHSNTGCVCARDDRFGGAPGVLFFGASASAGGVQNGFRQRLERRPCEGRSNGRRGGTRAVT